MNRPVLFGGMLLLSSTFAAAAPAITGISAAGGGLLSALSDTQTITINGTGFGTSNMKSEFLGGSNGFIDSLPNGTRIDTQNRPGWSMLQPSTATYPHVSTERAWSNGKSIAFDTRGTSEYKQTLFYDTGSTGYSYMYTNAMIYLSYDTLQSGSYLQWKIMRWYKVADVLDHANNLSGAYMSHPLGVGHVGVFTGFNSTQSGNAYVHWFAQDLPDKGAWYRYETFLKMNSAPGTGDGTFRVKVTNPTTGAVVTDNSISNIMFNAAADVGNFRYVVLQNYFGNASDGGYSQSDNAHGVAWWDDVYISQTQARVEICNAATWAACGNREIQSASSWANGSITVKVNKAAISDLSAAYLYVVDANGAVNAQGYRLSVSGGSIAPSAPANFLAVPR